MCVQWMSMCSGLIAQSRGENKEFVVGLGCPGRLELWQL